MALQYSPKIVTDNLVMCLDTSQNKSYPTDLPVKGGLLLWLDAADDSTFSYSSGSIVSQWRDKSGLNNHANQSVVGNQPSRSTFNNSRKSVNFVSSGVDYLLVSANSNLALPGDASIFIVYKPATQTTAYAVLIDNYHGQGGAKGFVIQRVATNSQFYYGNGNGSGFVDTSASPWTYTDNVIQLLSLNKASSTGTPYISGTAQTSRTVHANTVQDTTGLAIGTWGLGGREYNGDMCEILIFNRSLSSTEMKQVHTYLGQKWGISNTDRSIIDLAGNNDNGLLGNGTVANMPVYNYYNKGGLRFNSSFSNYVISPNTTISGSQTFCVWAVMTGKQNSPTGVLSQHDYVSTANFGINILTSNQLAPSIGYTNGTREYQDKTTTGVISYNQIFNAVLVYNAGLNKIYWYINGVFDSEYSLSLTPKSTNWPIGLGRWDPSYDNYYFDGTIFSALVYNKALSPIEVAQNYEAQKSKFTNTIVQSGLVLNLDAGNPYSYAGAGTTIYDVSGNSNNGTLTNSPTYSNNSIVFSNSASQSISISDTAILQPTSVTLSAWIYMTQYNPLNDFDGQFPTILWKCNDGNSGGAASYGLSLATGGCPRFTITPTQLISTTTFPIATWVNLVGVYTVGGSQILYRNGVVDIATTGPATISYSSQVVSVGTRVFNGTYQYPWNGSISNALIHNRALTATEVLQNYNATKGRFGL